jgi:hypothetical protein
MMSACRSQRTTSRRQIFPSLVGSGNGTHVVRLVWKALLTHWTFFFFFFFLVFWDRVSLCLLNLLDCPCVVFFLIIFRDLFILCIRVHCTLLFSSDIPEGCWIPLQMVGSHYVAGYWIQGLWKSSHYSWLLSHLSSPLCLFVCLFVLYILKENFTV